MNGAPCPLYFVFANEGYSFCGFRCISGFTTSQQKPPMAAPVSPPTTLPTIPAARLPMAAPVCAPATTSASGEPLS